MDSVTITWMGHSCFVLEYDGYRLVLDPYAPDYVPGLRLPDDFCANEVICSHSHKDHACVEAVRILPGKKSPFTVTALSSFHDHHSGSHRGENQITVITAGALRVAHFGDLGTLPDDEILNRLLHLDAAFIPVGGCYTIDAAEALGLIGRIVPKVIFPMHYRTKTTGFPVLATADAFLAGSKKVERYPSRRFTLTANTPAQTALLQLCD